MQLLALPEDPRANDRFTTEEQVVAVWLSHMTILVVVSAIMLVGLKHWPSKWFLLGEGIIWLTFTLLFFRPDALPRFVARYFPSAGRSLKDAIDGWQQKGPPFAFALAFFLQFAALTPLLEETGGPIDSPFTQLAVAFAVFTPILANRIRTIVIALLASIGYYWVMIEMYGFGSGARPNIAVFGAVTTLILTLTVGLATLDRLETIREPEERDEKPEIGSPEVELG